MKKLPSSVGQMFEKASLHSLQADKAVMAWIAEHVSELKEEVASVAGGGVGLEGLAGGVGAEVELARMDLLAEGALSEMAPGEFGVAEAIVQLTGRPPLLIQDGQWEDPRVPELRKRLNAARKHLEKAIPKVGRVELRNSPNLPYVGTGWMIDDDVLITNRHVANEFAFRSNGKFLLRTTPSGQRLQVDVDFKEEFENSEELVAKVEQVLFIEEDSPGLPDMALLRLKKISKLPEPIELSATKLERQDDVAVIGYPARDGTRNDPFVMSRLFRDIYDVKRLSPGKVTGVDERRTLLSHDCTTLGGNSGSVVVSLRDGKAAGLHFSGRYRTNNFAVTSDVLRKKLGELGRRSVISVPQAIAAEEKVPTAAELRRRKGYNVKFLGRQVPLPTSNVHELAPVTGRTDGLLHYLHFSVAVHKSRRLALFTAVNIDGRKLFNIRRTKDVWNLDPRMETKFQVGPDLYKGNALDRGHLVRRLDPAWGDSREEAIQAADDTFFYTNSTPQHEQLNQRTWLELEDHILDNADTHDLKVTVFTGPVFRDSDRSYRKVKLPEEFWKVVTIINKSTGELSSTGYLLSQADLIEDLEFAFGAFKTYQLPLRTLETKTGLSFGALVDFDPLDAVEATVAARVIRGPDDLRL